MVPDDDEMKAALVTLGQTALRVDMLVEEVHDAMAVEDWELVQDARIEFLRTRCTGGPLDLAVQRIGTRARWETRPILTVPLQLGRLG